MRRTFNVAVSLTKNDYAEFELRPPINMVSGDHGTNILKFTVYDNGLPVDLSGNIAKITCKTPSGNRQQQDMTISTPREGKMEVVLDQRFFAEGGTYLAEVQLYDPANLKVRATLPRFTYNVDASLLEENRVIANEQFSILQQMVDTVASAEERSVQALDTATRAMNIATQKGDKATEEANRAKNEADRAKNEADRAWAADFAKHVTLDSEAQQKFDFIKNKVGQDGLKHLSKISPSTVKSGINIQNDTDDFDIMIIVDELTRITDTANSIVMLQDSASAKMDMRFQLIGGNYRVGVWIKGINNIPVLKQVERPRYIGFKRKSGVYYSYTDTQVLELGNTTESISFVSAVFGYRTTEHEGLIVPIAYNRELSQEEKQHNLSTFNNPPSVKELDTTDSTGKTSILNIASSEDFVEMSTGRTLREEYMGVLKAMGEEVPSADGSPVKVNNGIEARLINAEIKGQTILNLVNEFKTVQIKPTVQSFWEALELDSNRTYYLNVYVEDIVTNASITEISLDGGWSSSGTPIHKLVSGWNHILLTNNHVVGKSGLGITCDATCTFSNVSITPDKSYKGGVYCSGLNSTQAIISNNGEEYPIYEPTIQGKTRILNAQGVEVEAGTAGARLVSLESNDSRLPKLGSVPFISDFIDGAGKILTIHTKEEILNHAGNWKVFNTYNNVVAFELAIDGAATDAASTLKGVCDRFIYEPTFNDKEHFYFYTNRVRVFIDKSKASTIEQFKTWLQANPTTIRYQLATPIITKLTAEQMKAYNAYKKVILLGGVGDVKDTLEILEDGSAIWAQNVLKYLIDGSSVNKIRLENTSIIIDGSQGILGYSGYNNKIALLSSRFTPASWNNGFSTEGSIYMHPNGALFIRNTEPKTLEEVKLDLSSNPIEVIGFIPSPIITHIPKELVPSILTHKTNTLEVAGAVKPSSFKVTVPVDQIATINAELAAIKAVLNSPSNLLLSAKYVEDEFNKNNKLESEMMN